MIFHQTGGKRMEKHGRKYTSSMPMGMCEPFTLGTTTWIKISRARRARQGQGRKAADVEERPRRLLLRRHWRRGARQACRGRTMDTMTDAGGFRSSGESRHGYRRHRRSLPLSGARRFAARSASLLRARVRATPLARRYCKPYTTACSALPCCDAGRSTRRKEMRSRARSRFRGGFLRPIPTTTGSCKTRIRAGMGPRPKVDSASASTKAATACRSRCRPLRGRGAQHIISHTMEMSGGHEFHPGWHL